MKRSIDQKRAVFALEFVTKAAANCKEDDRAKLATHIEKTPIRVLRNGLGQALAFLVADNEGKQKPSGRLYGSLEDWLCGQAKEDRPCRVYPTPGPGQSCNLMRQLITGERVPYLRAQDEALRLFDWFKKFSSAYLVETKQGG